MINDNQEKRVASNNLLFVISTIILMLLYVLPISSILVRNDALGIIITIYYFLFIRRYVPISKVISLFAPAFIYVVLYLISFNFDIKLGFILPLMTVWTLLFPCLVAKVIVERCNIKEINIISLLTIIVFGFVSVMTVRMLSTNPDVMRTFGGSSDPEQIRFLASKGVGSYGYAYTMGALFVATWCVPKFLGQKMFHWKQLLPLLAIGYVVLNAQFATLIFITFFSVIFYFYITANTASEKFMFVLLALIVVVGFRTIIEFGLTFFDGQTIGTKFQYIYDGIWGNSDLEHVSSDRSEYQMDAFRMFLRSPIWGSNIFSGRNYTDYFHCHSTILGIMASTGLIGIVSYILCFSNCIRFMMSHVFNTTKELSYVPVIFYYVLFAFFNPNDYTFESAWVVFLTTPLLYVQLKNRLLNKCQ